MIKLCKYKEWTENKVRTMITTALFDIKRQVRGDGRSIDQYLKWFEKTLQVKCDMTIYTEEIFKNFVEIHRSKISHKTEIIVQDLQDVPFWKNKSRMQQIMFSNNYRSRMKSPNRIECYLPEYNLIQYSKFGWLKTTAKKNPDHDFFFWMDAGCSRFFLDFDFDDEWPNTDSLNKDKFVIQRNINFPKMWPNLNIQDYIWESECMLVGTLFGGSSETVFKMKEIIEEITESVFFKNDCINNEQFALAIASKLHVDLFDVREQRVGKETEGSSHLPLFKCLTTNLESQNE